ncbi:MAG TPA: sensor histidine kinase [Janthinobacterium sp.]|nr:sensor histidine kinase [Janthinobacterium sp.]
MRGQQSVDQIAREYGTEPSCVSAWARRLARDTALLFEEDVESAPHQDTWQERVTCHAVCTALPGVYLPPAQSGEETALNPNARYFRVEQTLESAAPPYFILSRPGAASDAGALLERYAWLEARVSQLNTKHLQVKQALVSRIFEHERAEEALRQSEIRLHELLAHQEYIKEEERKRIAREIHDQLGQNLMALRIDISALEARSSQAHPRLRKWVGAALDNLDGAVKSVRAIINDLRPFELELGLLAAVEWQLKNFARISGITYELKVGDTPFGYEIGDQSTLALFRILQEALSNITRHSMASKAEVSLSRSASTLFMAVRDNGIGAFPNDKRKPNSFGLVGIGERLNALGGEFSINGSAGKGFTLSISIPIVAAG